MEKELLTKAIIKLPKDYYDFIISIIENEDKRKKLNNEISKERILLLSSFIYTKFVKETKDKEIELYNNYKLIEFIKNFNISLGLNYTSTCTGIDSKELSKLIKLLEKHNIIYLIKGSDHKKHTCNTYSISSIFNRGFDEFELVTHEVGNNYITICNNYLNKRNKITVVENNTVVEEVKVDKWYNKVLNIFK